MAKPGEWKVSVKPFDTTLKALVELEPESWPAQFGCPQGATKVIDADIATVTGAADKVLRVDAKHPYLLHLEFVAGHDSAVMPRKLLLRNALLDDRHDLPVRTGVVLLHPGADSPQLTGIHERGLPAEDTYLRFRYQVLRVWQMPPDPLLTGSLALLPLAPISDVTEKEIPGIIRRMEQRLRGVREQAQVIWAASYVLLGLRFSSALAAEFFRGIVSMKESATYQSILEEGRVEGRSEGAVAEARRLLRRLGEGAFGLPDPRTAKVIEQLDNLERLEHLCEQVRNVRSWKELLGAPPVARRGERKRRS